MLRISNNNNKHRHCWQRNIHYKNKNKKKPYTFTPYIHLMVISTFNHKKGTATERYHLKNSTFPQINISSVRPSGKFPLKKFNQQCTCTSMEWNAQSRGSFISSRTGTEAIEMENFIVPDEESDKLPNYSIVS